MRAVAVATFLLAFAPGCASPQKRFEQASQDEADGRWAAAAEKYIDVLRRDPEYPGARVKAAETGSRAIEGWVQVAGGLESAGRHDRALDEYRRTDGLMESAAAVGVVLQTPADYTQRRRATFQRAADQALTAADQAAAGERWLDAAKAYRRVEARYELTTKQRARARSGRLNALLGGARAEMDAGHYDEAEAMVDEALTIYGADSPRSEDARELRADITERRYRGLLAAARASMEDGKYQRAFAIVEEALSIYGPDAQASQGARTLRERIVAEGTIDVVVVPTWKHESIADLVPPGLLGDIDSVLEEEYWTELPMFVAVVDPAAVHKRLRRLELDREVLSTRRAATLGQGMSAEFVAVLYLVRCEYDAGETPTQHNASTRHGSQVTFDLFRKRTINVRCAYQLVDARDGVVVVQGALDAAATRRHPHALYRGGNGGDLLLTREEHRWFDERRLKEIDREMESGIARDLAKALAEALLNEVTQRLP